MHRLARWMMGLLVLGAGAAIAASILSPIWPDLGWPATAVVAALALGLLHLLLRYAESRGWIYYVKGRGSHGGLGVQSNFLNMYDPSRKHLQQTVRESEWKRDEDDEGDDPEP